MGKGLENTNRIVSNCTDANCAARLCANYSVGSITSGWFLPSRDETLAMLASLYPMGVLPPFYPYWTSSEMTAANATVIDYSLSTSTFTIISSSKDWYYTVRPVRRY
jgi:hypothetical protein